MTPDLSSVRSPTLTLREKTAEHHRAAERAPFQRAMVSGQLALSDYLSWLSQMQFVFSALAKAALPDGPPGPIQERRWDRSADLLADCRFFDFDPTGLAPTEATARFTTTIDRWAAESPMALLGALYVFEGSTNGGRFIAKAVSRGFRLTDRSGTLFLDPYGEDQRSRWNEFKEDLDRSIGPEAIDQVVAAAQDTFGAVAEIGELVYRPRVMRPTPVS